MSALLLNALKALGGIGDQFELISAQVLEPICDLKTRYLLHRNPRLHTDEVLLALTISALTNPVAQKAKEAGVESVVFDRNGYLYHGRVKSLADAARKGGLNF